MEDTLYDYWWILIILSLWSLPWKGWALWKSAKANDKWWFILLLLVNTLGKTVFSENYKLGSTFRATPECIACALGVCAAFHCGEIRMLLPLGQQCANRTNPGPAL